ncbi:MAG: ABC transporter permease [Bacteroidales bacterium]|jgi:peptide/nickel transport system permease protein|nr:ABC transporter permease [Bacteroidales bacterium]
MRLRKRQKAFVEAAAQNGSSLDSLFWRRLTHNPMAVGSMVVILLFVVMALLGYLITPDHTPYCNQQYLELASQKPLSKATFVYVQTDSTDTHERSGNIFSFILHGRPLEATAIPVYSYHTDGDSIRIETFTGSIPNDGEQQCFHRSQVNDIRTRTFLFGTDTYGRDVLSQVMIGSRVSLSVGFIAVAIALLIGILLGALAAYYGGWVDNLILWLINVVWSIPTVLLVIAITFALGKGFWQVFIAVGLTMWVDVARVVRGQVLSIKEKEYVEAARALGYRTPRIIFRHILPNIMGPVIVITASNFATAILLEAGLSFLGIGVQPPMPSWGSMVKENYGQILLDSAYQAFIPGIAIMIIVLAFMILGNGIRDALDIKN